jgi:hypothetical protein
MNHTYEEAVKYGRKVDKRILPNVIEAVEYMTCLECDGMELEYIDGISQGITCGFPTYLTKSVCKECGEVNFIHIRRFKKDLFDNAELLEHVYNDLVK